MPELPTGAGPPIVFFPSCAPQCSICTLAATFVLLTQSLALWVLLSASHSGMYPEGRGAFTGTSTCPGAEPGRTSPAPVEGDSGVEGWCTVPVPLK